jgi:uncharacterized Tic20 family protein
MNKPTPQDERVMAALSHVTILIPLMGVVAPIVIWVTQREKSEFVAFQALQALAYQLLFVILWFLGWGCYLLSFSATMGGTFALAGPSGDPGPGVGLLMAAPFLVFGIFILLGVALVIYGIVATVLVVQGRDFRYALIGRWVERYLTQHGEPGM